MQTCLARGVGSGVQRCRPSGRPAGFSRPVAVRTAAFFQFGKKAAKAPAKAPPRPTVIPSPSYNVPLGLLAISGLSAFEGATPLAALTGLLGIFLTIQAGRVKFVFDDEALEVVIAGKEEKETENKFVGGRNRWTYDTFINWEFWWPSFPVLVYFKESQTKPEGQIHFFPIIFNGKELYDVMRERCGPTKTSGPK
ncbi:hypothetical protein Rsub_05009 [Raphidocelis subcapitata]|uniref:DUF3119 family protein n=1 Tax=Raphidocelis subcapitata TaxID=307507 RepID=A0A2V0P460_9CHLO|nr:hypothetical protein Rsub_05009 [Raphidocelis subcapitata]|eukprot:GBF92640.1 hypothetical protein Rsub_05009 [Raphidocelis subcapitata]